MKFGPGCCHCGGANYCALWAARPTLPDPLFADLVSWGDYTTPWWPFYPTYPLHTPGNTYEMTFDAINNRYFHELIDGSLSDPYYWRESLFLHCIPNFGFQVFAAFNVAGPPAATGFVQLYHPLGDFFGPPDSYSPFVVTVGSGGWLNAPYPGGTGVPTPSLVGPTIVVSE